MSRQFVMKGSNRLALYKFWIVKGWISIQFCLMEQRLPSHYFTSWINLAFTHSFVDRTSLAFKHGSFGERTLAFECENIGKINIASTLNVIIGRKMLVFFYFSIAELLQPCFMSTFTFSIFSFILFPIFKKLSLLVVDFSIHHSQHLIFSFPTSGVSSMFSSIIRVAFISEPLGLLSSKC